MPLCIINVDQFRFDPPKISWAGTENNIVYTNGDSKSILLNTIYDSVVYKTVQKFNGTDWVDICDIDTDYNVDYDHEGTDKYRLKVTKRHKVLYSNELTIVKVFPTTIEFDGDTDGANVCIKFTKDLPDNVLSYTLVVINNTGEERYTNKTCFQDNNMATAVYVEYKYSDDYKVNSNTLDIIKPDSIEITWKDGGTEYREGYLTGLSVQANNKNVSFQIYTGGKWVNAGFSNGWININEGLNNIRGILHKYNIISNELVYNRHRIVPLVITWDNGGTGDSIVFNGTNLSIKLHPGYLENGIKNNVMHITVDDIERIVNIHDISNMSFVSEGDKMQFKLKIHYNDGTVLESNTITSKRLLIPKITWDGRDDQPKDGGQNTVQIYTSDLNYNHTYKFERSFRTEHNDTQDNWEKIQNVTSFFTIDHRYANINTSQLGWYKFRIVSNNNPTLVSNVLEFHRKITTKTGTITWKGTTDKVIYNNTTPIVVNADLPDPGGSYYIVVNTYIRNYNYSYLESFGNTRTYLDKSNATNAGFLSNTCPDDDGINRFSYISSVSEVFQEGESAVRRGNNNIVNNNQVIKYNVSNISEVDISQSELIGFGVHYFSLFYTNGDFGTYRIGNDIIAVIRNNTLSISEYTYYDKWGISKQTPTHSQTRCEVKDSWSNDKSRGFIYQASNVDDEIITHVDGLNYKPKKILQKQRLNELQWTDVDDIDISDYTFTKEQGIVKYRIKSELHNREVQYSNEVYTFYVGDILKFDNDKYYIVENVFNKNDQGKYNNIENQHTISIKFVPTFTYQYQMLVNRGTSGFDYSFENVGNTFTQDDPLGFNDIFRDGYPNGIVLIRLECRTTLDTTIRYSNLIYAMFNGATMTWQEDANDSLVTNQLFGLPPYTFSIADIYKYIDTTRQYNPEENNGQLKIYINRTNTDQNSYQDIITQNQIINTENKATHFTKSINVNNIEKYKTYAFTFSWVNAFGIMHKGRSVIMATNINVEISVKYDNTFRIPYEVKTSYPDAADIYYDYQHPTIKINKYLNAPGLAVYTLQRTNLGSNNYSDVVVLPPQGDANSVVEYIVHRRLWQGKYRVKLTFNGTKNIYSNAVELFVFHDRLKVNNTYAVFGFNNTVADSEYDNQTDYNISYNLQYYPTRLRFKVQWSRSESNILANDTITTVNNQKVMSMNSFADIGREFAKNETIDIKQLVGRNNGLTRIRLKVTDGGNIIGYSNVIWIYLDNSIMYFVPTRYGQEDSSFAPYVEGVSANGRRERLIGSKVFGIQCRHVYPEQTSRIYMTIWDGTDNYNKYGTSLNTITGDTIYANRNRNPNVYLYHRKTYVPHFMVTLNPTEPALEQVVVTAELQKVHRWIVKEKETQLDRYLVTTSGTSSIEGNYHVFRYNNGMLQLPFEFFLYERRQGQNTFSNVEGFVEEENSRRDVDNNGLKERKYTYTTNQGTDRKIRIKYKDKYINETNVVYFEYFDPILSLDENRIGNDHSFFKHVFRYDSVAVYANRTESGYRYKFQQKIMSYKGLDEINRQTQNVTVYPGYVNDQQILAEPDPFTGRFGEPTGRFRDMFNMDINEDRIANILESWSRDDTSSNSNTPVQRDTINIDELNFSDYTGFFTSNDRVSHNSNNNPPEQYKIYVYRLAIFRGDVNVGYSNVVFFTT